MSQKRAGRKKRPVTSARTGMSRRRVVVIIGVVSCLFLAAVVVARWRSQVVQSSPLLPTPQPQASASPTPNPFVPKRAAKEYIYVGGKMQAIEEPVPAAGGTAFDFTGNASGDVVVYRPSEGNWYVLDITTEPATTKLQQLGLGMEKLVPGDYDGDGTTDIAIWRPNVGNCSNNTCGWQIKRSGDGPNGTVQYYADWGMTGDVAVPADYDGDGKMDRAVWRPSDGNWYIVYSQTSAALFSWGNSEDKPVPADYDGDGKADAAVFRPSEGNWYIRKSGGGTLTQGWGAGGDWLVPADYDGDGKADIAVWRPTDGNWYIRQSSQGGATRLVNWGAGADIPVPADYDGDGRIDIAVWRPSDGNWYIRKSSDGTTLARGWGDPTDIPVPSAFVRH
jgi:hypothetical protein